MLRRKTKSISLVKIYVDEIRCFKDYEMDFNSGLNTLVGPNAIGKSTLLQLIAYSLHSSYEGDKYLSLFDLIKSYLIDDQKLKPYFSFEFSDTVIDSKFLRKLSGENMLCTLPVKGKKYMKKIRVLLQKDIFNKTGIVRKGIKNISDFKGKNVRVIVCIIADGKSYNERIILKVGNSFYYVYSSQNFNFEFLKGEFSLSSLSFNESNYRKIIISALQAKREMKRHFRKVVKDSSTIINKISKSDEHVYEYTGEPRMSFKIFDRRGRDIDKVSAGEEQLNNLITFFDAVNELRPRIVLIDEPDLHLNYSQLPFVTKRIENLVKRGIQVIIATHSPFFIRASHINNIRLLKEINGTSRYISLEGKEKLIKKYISYPETFFCRKLIAVESLADKIFYERTFGVLNKYMDNLSLDQRNIEIVSGGGKTYMKKIYKLAEALHTECMFITDLDLFLQESDFNFLGSKFVNSVNILRKKVVKLSSVKSAKSMFSMNRKGKKDLFTLIDKVFTSGTVSKKDIDTYNKRFSSLIKKYVYKKEIKLTNLINLIRIKKIRKIFRKQNVWLLESGNIDDYVHKRLKASGKLSIDKLQMIYYPESEKDLEAYIKKNRLKEFKDISQHIAEWDSIAS